VKPRFIVFFGGAEEELRIWKTIDEGTYVE
jgi:hypothetical protein